ncbi:F0F1 ATP synthase subunit B [Elongatibacter sediminis]|uniref:ATP synthase subunit b n=1 Tax=Elongatibacter sediminis TaxID=3119006 RepID=A0AAW9RJY1_9GAMM
MNLNATLVLQSIAMMIFVWFCMKYIWPYLLEAMDERREKIAEGLAASDRAEKELEAAKAQVDQQIREARDKAAEIVEQANQRHSQILDQAKEDATAEKNRQVAAAQADIAQSANQAREALRTQVASLAVLGASKLLEKEVDENVHRQLLDELIQEI